MFTFFKWHKLKKEMEASVKEFEERNMDINEMLEMDDAECLVDMLRTWIYKKCGYGDCMEKLSAEEKVFYLVIDLEGEVINGGFSQFFDNSSGNFANETEGALRVIGAEKTADIYKKALDALGGQLPENREERWKVLMERETEEVSGILARYDTEFYNEPNDLKSLLYKYVMDNKEKFK